MGAGLGIILCASSVACNSFSYIGNIACLVTALLSSTVSSSPVTALVSVVQGIHQNHDQPPLRTWSYHTENIHGECLLNKVGGREGRPATVSEYLLTKEKVASPADDT